MKDYIRAGRYDDEIEYYQDGYGPEYIQLNDEHTVWKLDRLDGNASNSEAEDWDAYYYSLVNEACEKFEQKSGVEILLLGSSGRHVCVEDTDQNRRRYRSLCNLQMKLEDWVVREFNKAIAQANATGSTSLDI